MKQYKFLIIGGLHGNEPLGVELVKKIQKLNLPNIKAIYGNPEAIMQNKRFVDQDLNRVFPGKMDGNLEQKRAFEVIKKCEGFDFVLDFHNTHCPNNDCSFVGGDLYDESLKLSSFLGLNKIIVADYDCINKYIKNCLSVEISLSSKLNDVSYWIDKILSLADFDLNKPEKENSKLYSFAYRVSRQQQNQFKFENWKAFEVIKQSDVNKLGLEATKSYYPIFVDDDYTKEYNFAGLVEEMLQL